MAVFCVVGVNRGATLPRLEVVIDHNIIIGIIVMMMVLANEWQDRMAVFAICSLVGIFHAFALVPLVGGSIEKVNKVFATSVIPTFVIRADCCNVVLDNFHSTISMIAQRIRPVLKYTAAMPVHNQKRDEENERKGHG